MSKKIIGVTVGTPMNPKKIASITSYNDLTDVPEKFTPEEHAHNMSDVTGLKDALAEKVDKNGTDRLITQAEAEKLELLVIDEETGQAAISGTVNASQVQGLSDFLDKKVDKVKGKSLVDDTEIARLATLANYDDTQIKADIAKKADTEVMATALGKKVDKVDGHSLVPDTEITRLAKVDNYNDAVLAGRVATSEGKITNLETESAKHALKAELEAVDAKFANYNTTTVQKTIDDAQDARIKTVEDNCLVEADIANFETKENVKKVADDLVAYVESNNAAVALKANKSVVDEMYTNTQIDNFIASAKKYADDNDENTQYGIEYDSVNKKIKLTSNTSKTEIDATVFIKDGMIESVALSDDGKNLIITWNADSDKGENNVTTIPLSGLVDIYTGVDGTTVKVEVANDNKVSAEVKDGTIKNSHIASDAAIAKGKLASDVQTSLEKADSAIQEADLPTALPNPNKLTFTGATTGQYDGSSELTINIPSAPTKLSTLTDDATHRLVTDTEKSTWNAKADVYDIPTKLSDLTDDATHRVVTDTEKSTWDSKASTSDIPTKVSQLANDSGFITSAPVSSVNNKTGAVSLSASDVGAVPTTRTVNGKTLSSNISLSASDVGALPDTTTIPTKLSDLTADSTHRVVTDSEKSTWNAKANTSDIPTKVGDLTNDKGYITSYTETDPTVPSWAKASTKPSYTKSEVGLGNVDNVQQYSASNPPPYPVTKVNNKTGAVTLSASDVGADASGTASAAISSHNSNSSAHSDIRSAIETKANKSEGTFYVEGSGTTDSTNKISTWVGSSDRITEYYDGLAIRYKIGVAGQTTTTLNINNLGAKTVYLFNTTKLTTQFPVNSIINLIYHIGLNSGCWVCSDYDSNTNTYQRVYESSDNKEYAITSRYNTTDGSTYYAEYGRYTNGVTLNPSTNTITATKFKGALTGNADTATKATQDANGNVITSTYVSNSSLSSAINTALAQAKASGEFDGKDGKTPVKGVDYFTEAEKADMVVAVLEAIGCPLFGVIDENNHITFSGKNIPDGTYTFHFEMENGTTASGSGFTIDTKTYYQVTTNCTNCATNNGTSRVAEGTKYEATITANDGYVLKSITVTMNGVNITSSAVSGGKITVASVTGDIVITAVAEVAGPAYVNQIPISTDTDGSIYNGKGYKTNSRISSSDTTGAVKTQEGIEVTGFIKFKNGDVLRGNKGIFSTVNNDGSSTFANTTAYSNITCFDVNKVRCGSVKWDLRNGATVAGLTVNTDCSFIFDSTVNGTVPSNTEFIRVSLQNITDTAIITVNQEIE